MNAFTNRTMGGQDIWDTDDTSQRMNRHKYSYITREWLDEFERFDHFYKEDVEQIHIVCICIDPSQSIYNIHKDAHICTNSMVSQEELVYIIKKNIGKAEEATHWKHRLRDVLSYNFTIQPEEVLDGLGWDEMESDGEDSSGGGNNDNIHTYGNNTEYFRKHEAINPIYWDKTISLFQDVNTLYILLQGYETESTSSRGEKKKMENSVGKENSIGKENSAGKAQKENRLNEKKNNTTRKIHLQLKSSSGRFTRKRLH